MLDINSAIQGIRVLATVDVSAATAASTGASAPGVAIRLARPGSSFSWDLTANSAYFL